MLSNLGSNYFNYKKNRSNFKTEVVGGFSTFLCMAYICALNPIILSEGGFNFGGIFSATVISASVACFIMGLYGKTWPVGLASGMGINSMISFTVCISLGYSPEQALGAVFIAALLFLGVSLTPIRAWLINSIPKSLKIGIGCGIGLFIAAIGFNLMGIQIASGTPTIVGLGDLSDPLLLLGVGAFISMCIMEKFRIPGNIIIGIIGFSIIAWVFGLAEFNGIASKPPPMTYFMAFDIGAALSASMASTVFTIWFIDIFDSVGTLTSIANVTKKVRKDGSVENIDKALVSDSLASVIGSCLGTTTVTTYVESAAGVKSGAKTGMCSIVIGICFLFCLFFSPLFTSLPKQVDAAALLYISTLFVRNVTEIDFDDIAEAAPAVLAMVSMPFLFSISHGIAIAFVAYAAIKLCTGKLNKTSPAIWVIAILSVLSFWVG